MLVFGSTEVSFPALENHQLRSGLEKMGIYVIDADKTRLVRL